MGACITAPIGFVSSCAGGCLAAGCCKLATCGSIDSNKGARCLLFWLQVVAFVLAVIMSASPTGWLNLPCEKLDKVTSDLGICRCYGNGDETACYRDQIIYRTEASAIVVYLLLLILSVSGCGKCAAKSCPIGKFMILISFIVVSLFLPNQLMKFIGDFAGVLAAVFLVAQMLIVIDFGYTWNEVWYAKAQEHRRTQPRGGQNPFEIAIVISAAILCIAALVVAIVLCINFKVGGAAALVIVTFIVGLVLLFVSISEWCKNGNLLASSVVLFYSMWLAYEALAAMPDSTTQLVPTWFSLTVCALSLAAFAYGMSKAHGEPQARDIETQLQEQSPEAEDAPEAFDATDFMKQCLIHAFAAVYITSCWTHSRTGPTFASRIVALVLSLVLYGWTLVAPKILRNREFS